MLTPRSALGELVALADTWPLPSAEPPPATKRRAAATPEPLDAVTRMVFEVAAEVRRVLSKDPVLKVVESPLPDMLDDVLERWSAPAVSDASTAEKGSRRASAPSPPQRNVGDLGKLRSAVDLLEQTYLDDVDRALDILAADGGRRLFLLSAVCVSALSELRTRGWSDTGLRAWLEQFDASNIIEGLRSLSTKRHRKLECFIPVSGWDPSLPLGHLEAAPLAERKVASSLPEGPYLSLTIHAFDEASAAREAFRQGRRVLDAVALIRPELAASWAAPTIGVESGAFVHAFEVGAWRGSVEPLQASVGQIVRHRALGEACRYRVQAMQLRDPMTRLSLLWLGLERLVTPARDYDTPLEALQVLLPPTLALRKVSSEVEALARALDGSTHADELHAYLVGDGGPQGQAESAGAAAIDRTLLLDFLQRASADEARKLAEVGRLDVHIAQWLERTRMHMSGPQPERLSRFFEATRQRIAWQLLRLHRAHERRGTDVWPASWVDDLSLHAHHYLTIALLAVMNDPEHLPDPLQLLARRAGQYDTFLSLVQRGQKRALAPAALLAPMSLVGPARRSPSHQKR